MISYLKKIPSILRVALCVQDEILGKLILLVILGILRHQPALNFTFPLDDAIVSILIAPTKGILQYSRTREVHAFQSIHSNNITITHHNPIFPFYTFIENRGKSYTLRFKIFSFHLWSNSIQFQLHQIPSNSEKISLIVSDCK